MFLTNEWKAHAYILYMFLRQGFLKLHEVRKQTKSTSKQATGVSFRFGVVFFFFHIALKIIFCVFSPCVYVASRRVWCLHFNVTRKPNENVRLGKLIRIGVLLFFWLLEPLVSGNYKKIPCYFTHSLVSHPDEPWFLLKNHPLSSWSSSRIASQIEHPRRTPTRLLLI